MRSRVRYVAFQGKGSEIDLWKRGKIKKELRGTGKKRQCGWNTGQVKEVKKAELGGVDGNLWITKSS